MHLCQMFFFCFESNNICQLRMARAHMRVGDRLQAIKLIESQLNDDAADADAVIQRAVLLYWLAVCVMTGDAERKQHQQRLWSSAARHAGLVEAESETERDGENFLFECGVFVLQF